MVLNEDAPVFVDGIACWAREAHFGGIVVQPVAGWLKSACPRDRDRRKTLSDFRFNGRAVLEELIEDSPWGSSDQVLASLSIFPHPDVVTAANRRAIFRTKRGTADRGKIVDGVMSDDNHSPAMAFKWSTQFKPPSGSDLTCCHLYAASGDPDAYTDVRNLFLSQASSPS